MNCGRFCERLFCWVFGHPHRNQTKTYCSRTSIHSRCVSYENCKRLRRNYTLKCEKLLCNSYISLQFSYQFAIFVSVCNSHVLVYSSYVDVCNFHMSLQFSFEFAIFTSVCDSHIMTPALTYVALHGFYVTMTLNSLTPCQPRFSVEDKEKLELRKNWLLLADQIFLSKLLKCNDSSDLQK